MLSAPLHSLITDQVKDLNVRITDLKDEIDKRFANFNALISHQVADLKKQFTHHLDFPSILSYAAAASDQLHSQTFPLPPANQVPE